MRIKRNGRGISVLMLPWTYGRTRTRTAATTCRLPDANGRDLHAICLSSITQATLPFPSPALHRTCSLPNWKSVRANLYPSHVTQTTHGVASFRQSLAQTPLSSRCPTCKLRNKFVEVEVVYFPLNRPTSGPACLMMDLQMTSLRGPPDCCLMGCRRVWWKLCIQAGRTGSGRKSEGSALTRIPLQSSLLKNTHPAPPE